MALPRPSRPVISAAAAARDSFGEILLVKALFRTPWLVAASPTITAFALLRIALVLLHRAVLWALRTDARGGWLSFVLALIVPWFVGLLLAQTRIAG